MANRWKEIHWWQIDKRCWEATYGPNSQGSAHLREAKDSDGEPWPEWTGVKPYDHPDNEARETARKELERDLTIPDYTEIVGATVGHLMSIAAETIMAHLPTCIFLSHARQKTERYSVGEQSPQADRKRADDYVRGVGDQIKMIQYIRGRIGEDRDTVLNMGRIPDYDTREWMPSGLSKGKGRAPDDASTHAAEPAPKRARMTKAQAQCSTSTVTSEDRFIPLTPENEKASEPSTTEYDRGHSDTPDDEGKGSSNVIIQWTAASIRPSVTLSKNRENQDRRRAHGPGCPGAHTSST
jgi:hypothetical protein